MLTGLCEHEDLKVYVGGSVAIARDGVTGARRSGITWASRVDVVAGTGKTPLKSLNTYILH
jgi:hypothetical protein